MELLEKTVGKFLQKFPKTREGTTFLAGFLLGVFTLFLDDGVLYSPTWIDIGIIIVLISYFCLLLNSIDGKESSKVADNNGRV